MKSKITLLLIATILISILLGCVFYKPSIEDVTIQEIQTIQGIGETLSYRIVDYIGESETFDIEDLINVDGIGEERLKLLKGKFK